MQKKTLKPPILKERKSESKVYNTHSGHRDAIGETEPKHYEIVEWKKAFRKLHERNYYLN